MRIAWLSAAVDRLAATLDEEDQQIEIARNQWQLTSVSDEDPAAGREGEFAKAITWHSVGSEVRSYSNGDRQLWTVDRGPRTEDRGPWTED